MKRNILLAVSAILLIVIVAVTLIIIDTSFSADKPFYVGVTYSGDTVEGAKQLIDEVKNYTNLFILNSEKLQEFIPGIEEIGDYAIASGLNFATSVGRNRWHDVVLIGWGDEAQQRWGSNFIGIYDYIYEWDGDAPGRKILDNQRYAYPDQSGWFLYL
ncbi:MAG: hypothetical protein FWE73_06540 [Candidatus Bathyarchaeota archaeon]|nr:hypothetical protein [Candidatus Termitimicrobium sp.]